MTLRRLNYQTRTVTFLILLVFVGELAKKAGWDSDQLSAFVKEATSGDYDKAIQTAMKYFDVS